VQSIGRGHRVILSHDNHYILAYRDEILVRHAQALATGQFDNKRLKPIGEALAYAVEIHTVLIA